MGLQRLATESVERFPWHGIVNLGKGQGAPAFYRTSTRGAAHPSKPVAGVARQNARSIDFLVGSLSAKGIRMVSRWHFVCGKTSAQKI